MARSFRWSFRQARHDITGPSGRKRQKSLSVATRAEAKQAEARLITEVGAGQHLSAMLYEWST